MPSKKKKAKRAAKGDVAQVSLKGTEHVVSWKDTPPRGRTTKKIHPRRAAPPVPRGGEVIDEDPSPPVDIKQRKD